MIAGRITASHVGVGTAPRTQEKRMCFRCGCERSINGRQDPTKPFMCGDCKSVDPAMARRLGIGKPAK
jgi:hypothetical protein